MQKVLIAEDSKTIREALGGILAREGYEIIEATDGQTAFEKACRESPDLILMDIWMPDMDGLEPLRRLRENKNTQRLPVIMLTSVPPQEGEQEAAQLGQCITLRNPLSMTL